MQTARNHLRNRRITISLIPAFCIAACVVAPICQAGEGSQPDGAAPVSWVDIGSEFRKLWDVLNSEEWDDKIEPALRDFQRILERQNVLSPEALKVLKGISLEPGPNDAFVTGENEVCPAIAVLCWFQRVGLRRMTADIDKWTRSVVSFEIRGRASRHIEYGSFASWFDDYLALKYARDHIDVYRDKLASAGAHPPWPQLRKERLNRLREVFQECGEDYWEVKVLRWKLGDREWASGPHYLVSAKKASTWARLAQLQPGAAGELDRVMALASGAELADCFPPPVRAEAEVDESQRKKTKPSDEQCDEAIRLLCEMKVPWEAYLFVRHAKEKWDMDLSRHLEDIRELWRKEYQARSRAWKVVFVAGCRVKPETTLEEFAEAFQHRPNLPD